jgi:hypothetical protein
VGKQPYNIQHITALVALMAPCFVLIGVEFPRWVFIWVQGAGVRPLPSLGVDGGEL